MDHNHRTRRRRGSSQPEQSLVGCLCSRAKRIHRKVDATLPDGDLNISLRAGHAANIAAERLSLAAVIRPCLRYLLAITGAYPGALACSGAVAMSVSWTIGMLSKSRGHTTIVYFQLRSMGQEPPLRRAMFIKVQVANT